MMKQWTESDINKLVDAGKVKVIGVYQTQKKYSTISKKNIPAVSKEKEWLNYNMQYWANEKGITLNKEYQFHDTRKWRFDWAFPAIKVAVEYEGIYSAKSRHTTRSGFLGDVEKYNAATVAGWKVIRVTADNYKEVIKILNQTIS